MRFGLSNDKWFYVQENDVKLLDIEGTIHVVGDECLYGLDEDGTRLRINPSTSTYLLEEYEITQQVVDTVYDAENDVYEPVYADVGTWIPTDIQLSEYYIPPSMNANDTFNFNNLNPSLLLTFFLAIFVVFRIFHR